MRVRHNVGARLIQVAAHSWGRQVVLPEPVAACREEGSRCSSLHSKAGLVCDPRSIRLLCAYQRPQARRAVPAIQQSFRYKKPVEAPVHSCMQVMVKASTLIMFQAEDSFHAHLRVRLFAVHVHEGTPLHG